MSNAEIAGEFFVSETTVKTHVAHILAKIGLRDRVPGRGVRLRVGAGATRRSSLSSRDQTRVASRSIASGRAQRPKRATGLVPERQGAPSKPSHLGVDQRSLCVHQSRGK
jgi:hypothetical protein